MCSQTKLTQIKELLDQYTLRIQLDDRPTLRDSIISLLITLLAKLIIKVIKNISNGQI